MINFFRVAILSFLFLFFNISIFAQSNKKTFAVQGSIGLEVGWWIHNLGSTEPSILNNRGWARTHYTLTTLSELEILIQKKRWKFGIGNQGSLFMEDDIRENEDAVGNYDRVKIAQNNFVRFWKYSLFVEYDLFERGKWTVLSPHFRFGGFVFDSNHPDYLNFGLKTYYEVGFSNTYHFKKIDFFVRPKYTNANIGLKIERNFNEKHNITGVGANFGIRYWIF